MGTVNEKTTKVDQQIALSSIAGIRRSRKRFHSGTRGFAQIKFQEKDEFLRIPKKALFLLFDILTSMADGKSVTLIPSDAVVSTQKAADLLKVSRPHLVKLLENGAIPFKKAGSHRRIELKDLLNYQKKLRQNRRKKLNFLAEQAQEQDMGY
jgi:excisionase family DNA binding protein